MMITIHGFPAKTKYQDVKILIKQECNINDFILDNLITDADGSKKVRIGLTDNTEGFKVMKCLDGYRMPGNFVLKAVPVGKAVPSLPPQQSTFDSRPSYQNQARNDYSSAPRSDYMGQPSNDYNSPGSHGPGPSLSHGGLPGSTGPHGSVGSHGPRPSHSQGGPHVSGGSQGPIDMNRPSPWASGNTNSNQWNAPMAAQVPQNTFGFTSPQANINPSYGQQHQPHQGHSRTEIRPSFNQGRTTDQSYGYAPKSNVTEVVPANSRYRWVRKTEPEAIAPKSPHSGDDCSSPSADDTHDEKSQEVPNELGEESIDKLSKHPPGTTSFTCPYPPGTTKSKKAWKREQAKLRNISNLTGAQRRRLFFWLKQGKSFMEARELCEHRVKLIPEYPAAKAEKKRKAREVALQRMSPASRERAIKVDRLRGRGLPGMPPPEKIPGERIRVRIVDKHALMSQEKIEMVEDKILELVDAETDGNGPNFVGCTIRTGCIILSCANQETVEWLEKHVPNFKLWEEAEMNVANVNDLPKPVIGVAFVADPDLDDEAIFRMLKSQNPGIDFSNWWITSKKPEVPAGQTVTFSFDQASLEKLAETNYFVFLGLKKTKIRIRSKKLNAPTGQKGEPPISQKGKVKGKISMPRKGQIGKEKKGMPNKKQIGKRMAAMDLEERGMTRTGPKKKASRWEMGMMPMDQMGMAPMDQMGMAPVGPMGMGQMGMPHMGPMGMGPMGPMDMASMEPMGMGEMGMAPMDQMGMPHMGPMGMPPMGPMGYPPMGPMGMPPMGPMGMPPMGPMGMPPMGPMGMAPMGPMGMGRMDFVPDASTSAVKCGPSGGSSYASSQPKQWEYFGGKQPKQFGGRNQPKKIRGGNQPKNFGGANQQKQFGGRNRQQNFGGSKKAKHNKKQGGAGNNGGPNQKSSPYKNKNKGRRMGNPRNGNPGPFKNEGKEPKRENKNEPL